MAVFFREVAKGYCYKQASDRCSYLREWVLNTLNSDDEVYFHMLDLAMAAGAKIRSGELEPPLDRRDGLYNKYLPNK